MTLEVAGQGVVGVAFETTQNTYLAPTDFRDRIAVETKMFGNIIQKGQSASKGGQWKIQSPPGGGTLIVVRLPLANVLLKDEVAA